MGFEFGTVLVFAIVALGFAFAVEHRVPPRGSSYTQCG